MGVLDGISKSGRASTGIEVRDRLCLLYEDTDGEGSLAVDFGLIVRKVLVEELEERLR